MKGLRRIQWFSVFLLASCLTACQVKRPKVVISDAKMENVLYDYHIAKAMGEEVPYTDGYKRVLYIESVFKKHGITQAEFDSSMVWFTRNPEVLTKIYEKVNARLKAERDVVNHLIAIRDNKPKESLPGDSIDVWAWQRIYQLTGTRLLSYYPQIPTLKTAILCGGTFVSASTTVRQIPYMLPSWLCRLSIRTA